MDKATSRRRLMALVKLLRELPDERFNYRNWVGEDWQGHADLSCGTVACAAGWATTIPELKEAGLYLAGFDPDARNGGINAHPRWGNLTSEEALAAVFGIEMLDAQKLFFPNASGLGDDAGPEAVADHIEKFVKIRFGAEASDG